LYLRAEFRAENLAWWSRGILSLFVMM
jgi:hypothetical protein